MRIRSSLPRAALALPVLLLLLIAAFPADAAGQTSRAADWRRDVPCTEGARPALRVEGGEPREERLAACDRSLCVTLADGRRVCSCLRDDEGDQGPEGDHFRVERGGELVAEVPASFGFGAGTAFDVARGDLDGDGAEELVVANLEAVSNGLGVEYWTVYVFGGRDPALPPLRFRSEQYATRGAWTRPAAGGPCRVLVTGWEEMDDPRRGGGMYFVGQWMRYEDGRLVPEAARPVLRRRLLHSFPRQAAGAPFALFRDPRAEESVAFPVRRLPLAGTHRGTLRRLGDTVEVALEGGRTLRYEGDSGMGLVGDVAQVWLAGGATGRPFPIAYVPADPRALVGRPVTVHVRAADGDEIHWIVVEP